METIRWRSRAAGTQIHRVIETLGAHLAIYNDGTATAGPRHTALCFDVADVDEAYGRLRELDIPVHQPPADQPWGMPGLLFRDPDGNEIAFRCPVRPK